MKKTLRIILLLTIGLSLTLGIGYAGEKMPKAGFLSDYSRLKKDPQKKLDWTYEKSVLKGEDTNVGTVDLDPGLSLANEK